MTPPWQLQVYRAAAVVLSPAILLHLLRRRMLGLETSIAGRLGFFGQEAGGWGRRFEEEKREDVTTVWVHGASVGESLSGLALARLLSCLDPSMRFVVTSGTVSGVDVLSSRIASDRKAHGAIVGVTQAPLDIPWCVRGFLTAWKPRALVCIESDLWPNMLWECHRQHIPLLLVDGRMSARSASRWSIPPARGLISALLSRFSLVLCQSPEDAARLEDLGAKNAACVGSAKVAAGAISLDAGHVEPLARSLVGRLVWTAASTHHGEEEIAAEAHAGLLTQWAQQTSHQRADSEDAGEEPPLLVIIPRHPHRAEAVARAMRDAHPSWQVELLLRPGEGLRPGVGQTAVVAGYMGATGPWMSLSRACLVGGSMVKGIGGHNVMEPARLGCAVVHGEHVEAARHLIEAMLRQHPMSLRRAKDARELEEAIADAVLRGGRGGEWAREAAEGMEEGVRKELCERVLKTLDATQRLKTGVDL